MSLLNDLTADMVSAMKNRDKETLATVRMLKAAVQNEQIEQGHDLTSDEEIAVMAREYKQRKESLEEFEQAGRQDLVDKTKAEMKVVEKYMPQQLSADDVKKIVDETIKAVNASSMKDFGKVMGAVMPKVKGRCGDDSEKGAGGGKARRGGAALSGGKGVSRQGIPGGGGKGCLADG